jgi:hypothetical protein
VADLDLRPLSLGELLDRAFSLYRRHFWLFVGINAIPQLILLTLRLAEMSFHVRVATFLGLFIRVPELPAADPAPFGVAVGVFVTSTMVTLLGQAGTIYAASEVYFGRQVSAHASLWRVRRKVVVLIGLWIGRYGAALLGLILLIVPGVYWYCRTLPSLAVALLEDLGPLDSLGRGWNIAKGFVARAFVIYLLYYLLIIAINVTSSLPFTLIAQYATRDPEVARRWMELAQVGSTLTVILVVAFLGIAECIFYFDLRVRKEAFDLQLMLNPSAIAGFVGAPTTASRVGSGPSIQRGS